MSISWSGVGSRVRRFTRVCGVGSSGEWVVFNNSGVNLQKAIAERVFRVKVGERFVPPPRPIVGAFERCNYQRAYLVRFLPRRPRLTRDEFVGLYSGPKRKLYQNAVASLSRLGLRRSDSRVKAFVKKEKQQLKSGSLLGGNAVLPVPRVIQPRDPRYNVELGRYTRAIEEDVYECLAGMFSQRHVVMKGLNSEEQASVIVEEWNKYSNPVAVGLDASRFDQHCSVDALRFEHSIYNGVFKTRDLAEMLSWQLKYKLTARSDGGDYIRAVVEGCRSSGDMNTGLGNVIIMVSMIHAYLRTRRVNGSLINNGDDCVVIFERRDLQTFSSHLKEWFLQMGYNMTVESSVSVLEQIVFCQCQPVFNGLNYVMVRGLKAALQKDTISITKRNVLEMKHWMGSVGDCGLAIANGIPIMQEFYQMFSRHGVFKRRLHDEWSGLRYLSKGLVSKYREIHPRSRLSFYLAFGINEATQRAFESRYALTTLELSPRSFFFPHHHSL